MVAIASSRQCHASVRSPSPAWALARHDQYQGTRSRAPVLRAAVIPAVIIGIANEAFPVNANRQPWVIIPAAFQYEPSISSAIVISC